MVTTHITKFKKVLVTWDIMDEDTIRPLFMMSPSLGGNQKMDAWYDEISCRVIPSFRQLIKVLCDQWDPSIKKELLKTMEDEQVSEEPKQLLAGESEYQEAIIEETKEHIEKISYPPLRVSYDILFLLEESF